VYLARHEPDEVQSGEPDSSIESIHPAGQPPQSPDLRDPFGKTRDSSAPKPEAVPSSGDLKDPFRNAPSGPPPKSRHPTPTPRPPSDLKDPFGRDPEPSRDQPANEPSPSPQDVSPDLKDPFSRDTSKDSGSDIVDPFGKQH
jgi:hypothetical protein